MSLASAAGVDFIKFCASEIESDAGNKHTEDDAFAVDVDDDDCE